MYVKPGPSDFLKRYAELRSASQYFFERVICINVACLPVEVTHFGRLVPVMHRDDDISVS